MQHIVSQRRFRAAFLYSLVFALLLLAVSVGFASRTASAPVTNTLSLAPSSSAAAGSVSTQTTQKAKSTHAAGKALAQSCTGTPYVLPAALPAQTLKSGLTSVIDNPNYYEVHGLTIRDLRVAIEACPLRESAGDYHAVTAYNLTWAYDVSAQGNLCTLSNVRVGLHVNQHLPHFIPGVTTPRSTASEWSAYFSALEAHEQGHIDLDSQYAERLLAAFRTVSGDCTTIDEQAATVARSVTTMLNTANELYDARTNHGATQGALL
jgi:predicted secreted Zn-dependent protease